MVKETQIGKMVIVNEKLKLWTNSILNSLLRVTFSEELNPRVVLDDAFLML